MCLRDCGYVQCFPLTYVGVTFVDDLNYLRWRIERDEHVESEFEVRPDPDDAACKFQAVPLGKRNRLGGHTGFLHWRHAKDAAGR